MAVVGSLNVEVLEVVKGKAFHNDNADLRLGEIRRSDPLLANITCEEVLDSSVLLCISR